MQLRNCWYSMGSAPQVVADSLNGRIGSSIIEALWIEARPGRCALAFLTGEVLQALQKMQVPRYAADILRRADLGTVQHFTPASSDVAGFNGL